MSKESADTGIDDILKLEQEIAQNGELIRQALQGQENYGAGSLDRKGLVAEHIADLKAVTEKQRRLIHRLESHSYYELFTDLATLNEKDLIEKLKEASTPLLVLCFLQGRFTKFFDRSHYDSAGGRVPILVVSKWIKDLFQERDIDVEILSEIRGGYTSQELLLKCNSVADFEVLLHSKHQDLITDEYQIPFKEKLVIIAAMGCLGLDCQQGIRQLSEEFKDINIHTLEDWTFTSSQQYFSFINAIGFSQSECAVDCLMEEKRKCERLTKKSRFWGHFYDSLNRLAKRGVNSAADVLVDLFEESDDFQILRQLKGLMQPVVIDCLITGLSHDSPEIREGSKKVLLEEVKKLKELTELEDKLRDVIVKSPIAAAAAGKILKAVQA